MTTTAFSQWNVSAASNLDMNGLSLAENVMLPSSVNNVIQNMMAQLAAAGFVTTSSYTAADVLTKIKTVDGTGSGLDADLLDGHDSTYFQVAANLGNTIDALAAKATPVDADEMGLADSAAAFVGKKVTFLQAWTNYFKVKADALYQPLKTILTTLGNLANGSGYLSNDGAGALSWATPSAGQPIPSSSTYAVGTLIFGKNTTAGTIADGATIAGSSLQTAVQSGTPAFVAGGAQTGTWTNRSGVSVVSGGYGMFSRTA